VTKSGVFDWKIRGNTSSEVRLAKKLEDTELFCYGITDRKAIARLMVMSFSGTANFGAIMVTWGRKDGNIVWEVKNV